MMFTPYHIHFITTSRKEKIKKILSPKELQEGYEAAKIADKTLKRNFDSIQYPYVKNLLARNWFQVKNSESIFAISKRFISNSIVDGGTGWAIQMAIDNNKPIYVFDQVTNAWYTYTVNNIFEPIVGAVPKLTKNFAGIGTRDLMDNGLNAIVNVYTTTFAESII